MHHCKLIAIYEWHACSSHAKVKHNIKACPWANLHAANLQPYNNEPHHKVRDWSVSKIQAERVWYQYDSRGKILDQPVVLVTANIEVSIVGEVDHVSWSHIGRVPKGVV